MNLTKAALKNPSGVAVGVAIIVVFGLFSLSRLPVQLFPVFKILEDGTAEKVSVETGVGCESLIEVRGRVGAGDKVVVRGSERLRPGQSVVISSGTDGSPAG